MKIKIILLLLVCIHLPYRALSQDQSLLSENAEISIVDERLWAIWNLETVELTTGGAAQKYSIEALRANKNMLPRNMFTSLYFFNNQVGVHSTETEFAERVSLKGSFTTNSGELIITMYGKQPRRFTYEIEDEILKIRYRQADTQYYLIYKLEMKNVR